MPGKPEFDLQVAHKFFAAQCFNEVWGLIDKADRSPEENEGMIRLCQASIWHWTQRDDCTPQNLSVGFWQASRVFALIGDGDAARRYGQLSLMNTANDQPFYVGFAYEALARAEAVCGNREKKDEYLAKARATLAQIEDEESRKMLGADLESIE